MQRFWDSAEIEPVGAEWRIVLDDRAVNIPGGGELRLPVRALAAAVAAEWQAAGGRKGGRTSYADLPLTRIAGTGQVRIASDPEPVVLELARYAESDLLCYRAADPPALLRRQAERWQPWLDWAAGRHGAPLAVTTGVVHVAQPAGSLAALAAALAALGLALAEGALDGAAAHGLATLDETFQEEFWGTDADAVARRRRIGDEVAVAARFLELLRA